jgi:hypothetical protein
VAHALGLGLGRVQIVCGVPPLSIVRAAGASG